MAKRKSKLLADIHLLYELRSLRFVDRTWRQYLQVDVANNAEHIFSVIWIALAIARHEGIKNEEKIIKMALLHDVAETRTPDTNYVSKIYSSRDEDKAIAHMLEDTVFAKEFEELFREYEERKTIESKIVKDADNLDVDFELSEIVYRGHNIKKGKPWKRLNVRKNFFTKTAGLMWDELQAANPTYWHQVAHEKFAAPKDRK